MDKGYGLLGDDEVLYVNFGRILMANPTFKVSELLDALAQLVSEREVDWSEETEGWFGDGLECEALRVGNQGWQRGKVRIRLEFCPAEDKPKLLKNPVSQREEPYQREVVRPREEPYPRDEPYSREDTYRRSNREEIYPNRGDFYGDIEEDY
ncbi:KGK domain-containing protein [Oculatella sp. LEGE 06141]|uniref:KGK domain-containing protein n=1 Tax=Oculatella sp. LEGE 06141 TaxID=1828648 RepID=UPI00187FDDA6|nr:KGK domain-containing protein [Oculatella sp. LEGE 06141]MBE9177395.1 KGK domain-containing protein [Oculatella sp. LEGE 06141]